MKSNAIEYFKYKYLYCVIILFIIMTTISFCFKLKAKSLLANKNMKSLKSKIASLEESNLLSNSESQNTIEYFSNDAKKFPGKFIYDFGHFGQFYGIASNGTEIVGPGGPAALYEGDFGKIIFAKKMNDKTNKDYVIKMAENIDLKLYTFTFRKCLALIMKHSVRPPKQSTQFYAVKTYVKNGKKSIAFVMNFLKGKNLFDVVRDPDQYLKNKNQIINVIYSTIKAVYEFHYTYQRTHYDLKPSNIFIEHPESNCQKAVLMSIEGSLTKQEEAFAELRIITNFYTSPHFKKENKVIQRFTDNYALGVIVLQVLANIVDVHMDYTQKFFWMFKDKYIAELESKKAEMEKYLTAEEFEDILKIGKALINHQDTKIFVDMIEKKYGNFICINN